MNWTSLTSLVHRPPIGWWDLADILVVSILIYEILKLIRGTRAVQMAVGAGLLAVLFYGSRSLHLDTVNWLVRNLVGYFVFGFIVRQLRCRLLPWLRSSQMSHLSTWNVLAIWR